MPDIEQLTEHAVQAEEILETINTGAEMSESLDVGVEPRKISQEDKELLDEILGKSGAEASPQPDVSERRKRRDVERPAESAGYAGISYEKLIQRILGLGLRYPAGWKE